MKTSINSFYDYDKCGPTEYDELFKYQNKIYSGIIDRFKKQLESISPDMNEKQFKECTKDIAHYVASYYRKDKNITVLTNRVYTKYAIVDGHKPKTSNIVTNLLNLDFSMNVIQQDVEYYIDMSKAGNTVAFDSKLLTKFNYDKFCFLMVSQYTST